MKIAIISILNPRNSAEITYQCQTIEIVKGLRNVVCGQFNDLILVIQWLLTWQI